MLLCLRMRRYVVVDYAVMICRATPLRFDRRHALFLMPRRFATPPRYVYATLRYARYAATILRHDAAMLDFHYVDFAASVLIRATLRCASIDILAGRHTPATILRATLIFTIC